jgi:beta-phosphoglucomutase-like phosphatase (HAD superfamily)
MEIGALFDWDGVVIDSSKCHEASWDLLADEVGKPLPEGHFKKGFGRKNQVIIPEILQWTEDPFASCRHTLCGRFVNAQKEC